MADQIRATPRSPILGLFSDLVNLPLQYMSAPERTQQMQGAAQFLYGTGIPKTLERASYGESLFSGSGMTLRPKEETINAAMTVAPFAPFAPVAGRTGQAFGRMAGEEINAAMTGQPTRSVLGAITPKPKLLDVYHGTPHRLPPTERNPLGEFDASKIGTGEGNQAYGYGIYTAENPAVAKGYAEQLSTAQGSLGDVAKYWRENGGESAFRSFAKDAGLESLEVEKIANVIRNKGNLYKVDLPDEKIATMLDWDKPLSQQPKTIQNWLKDSMNPYRAQLAAKDVGGNEPTGSLIYNRLAELMSEGKKSDVFTNAANYGAKNASQELADFGIAGIKYLDEGSRATTGKQTSNFVVFPNEEKSMTILERNGMPASQIQTPTYSDPFGNTIGSSIR